MTTIQPLFDALDATLANGLRRAATRAEHIRWVQSQADVQRIKEALHKGVFKDLDGEIDWPALMEYAGVEGDT